ncbi:MAG TPA: hypothetical protein VNT81_18655 [Vicinamibacterales bacterium]|nr:hypothetical protein [Vicinamibacterales bacterium]
MTTTRKQEWTAKSVGLAFVVSLSLMLVFLQLREIGIGVDLVWEPTIVPALAGAVVLAVRHRRTWLLALVLYMPSAAFVLYWLMFLMAMRAGNVL